MKAIELLLTTLTPVLVTDVSGGDINSEVTLAYIPGSTLRGALVGRWLAARKADSDFDAAQDPDFRRLFLDGAVCYLNAYPATETGARMLPTPTSWRTEKDGDPASLTDFVFEKPMAAPGVHQRVWQAPKKGAYAALIQATPDASDVALWSPEESIAIHTARENRQKVTSNATVFRYDALAAGQTFAFAIVAEHAHDLDECLCLLPNGAQFHLGRSQNAGYGLVEISHPVDENGRPRPALHEEWCEWCRAGVKPPAPPDDWPIVVTLLSHAIIRDPLTGAEVSDIAPAISLTPEEPVQAIDAYVNTSVVGGFNRRWNLPLPQATAIRAGSVFVYPREQTLVDHLNHLAAHGIGERRAEGFGRIAVDWQHSAELTRRDREPQDRRNEDVMLAGENVAMALTIAKRILRTRLDTQLLTAINNNELQGRGISKSQLSRLRVVIQRALEEHRMSQAAQSSMPALAQHLKDLKKPARDQLSKASCGAKPLLRWLADLVDKPAQRSQALSLSGNKISVTIGGQTATVTASLQIEYVLRLIDGVILLATKKGEASS
ncbi:MAG: hypothetical protein WAU00_08635 [Caldilinea sp.]